MRNKNLFTFFLIFLCFCFTNCSDDEKTEDIHHLSFEKDYYERPLIGAKSIMIRSGNKDYSVEIKDPSILDVKIDLSSPIGMGNLDIYPKQKGETTIQVKDNIVHETTDLRIKIVDSYLHLSINNPVRPPYKQGDEIFLINNDDKDFYLYDDKLKITLRIADLKTPLALRVDYGADEKYWRDAADLFNKRWAFYKDKYKDGLMDSESMMAMVAVEMARLYCEMVQDRKTLLADLRKLEAEAAKILDGHTGE